MPSPNRPNSSNPLHDIWDKGCPTREDAFAAQTKYIQCRVAAYLMLSRSASQNEIKTETIQLVNRPQWVTQLGLVDDFFDACARDHSLTNDDIVSEVVGKIQTYQRNGQTGGDRHASRLLEIAENAKTVYESFLKEHPTAKEATKPEEKVKEAPKAVEKAEDVGKNDRSEAKVKPKKKANNVGDNDRTLARYNPHNLKKEDLPFGDDWGCALMAPDTVLFVRKNKHKTKYNLVEDFERRLQGWMKDRSSKSEPRRLRGSSKQHRGIMRGLVEHISQNI